ncbi:MAG: DivIVA domain-containing protein [Clostridia bacterium]|nr:DivIVA domain-containing protein [Clostridia bacterium]
MAKEFTLTENGYDPIEVDKYIDMIQSEYHNAVAWGEENEAKYEKLRKEMEELGVYFTIDENNQSEAIEKIFGELKSTVARIKDEADRKAVEIVEQANEKAKLIVRQAMENSVELRTENTKIMKNLESVNKMISVVLEKGSY